MNIPEIVKEYVVKHCKRMPETQKEVDEYLDLINHAKEYEQSLMIKVAVGERMMKRLGIKTPDEIKKEGQVLFNNRH